MVDFLPMLICIFTKPALLVVGDNQVGSGENFFGDELHCANGARRWNADCADKSFIKLLELGVIKATGVRARGDGLVRGGLELNKAVLAGDHAATRDVLVYADASGEIAKVKGIPINELATEVRPRVKH